MLEKILAIFILDTDIAGSTVAGAATESIVHPRKHRRHVAYHFARALSVGWLLATFVAPGIAHRFELSKPESIAVAFICGYAGVRILSTGEKAFLERMKTRQPELKG